MCAQDQHDRFPIVGFAFDFRQSAKALAGKAFSQQRQEIGDGRPGGELLIAGGQESFDGFHTEHVAEL